MPVVTANGPRTVGVLTAVYHAVRPSELEQSLQSIVRQTSPPDEWVIVVDGPVSDALRAVLDRIPATATPIAVQVLELPNNVGNGIARQAGLKVMASDYVAIQDADDISVPERLEVTVRFMEESDLDFAGSALSEFQSDPRRVMRVRRYPSTSIGLAKRLRVNNPLGHPSLVFRREAGLAAGGYQHLPGNEDYDFVARLVAEGYRGASLDRPLVSFRMGPEIHRRRGAAGALRSEWTLSERLRSYGVLKGPRRWSILGARLAYRAAPIRLRAWLYAHVVASLEDSARHGAVDGSANRGVT